MPAPVPPLYSTIHPWGRVARSVLVSSGTQATTSGTAWSTYLGVTIEMATWKYIEVQVTGAGAGAQTAEMGLYYSLTAPQKAALTLYRWEATGSISSLTTTGVKRNSTAFTRSVPAGMHLWAVMRTAMATTQPTCQALSRDYQQGHILTTAGASALTSAATLSGAIVAVTGSGIDLRATMD